MKFDQVFNFLEKVIKYRMDIEYGNSSAGSQPFNFETDDSELSKFVTDNRLTGHELMVLLLALVPHISPNFLTSIIQQYFPKGGEFPEFGGVRGKNHRGILPTGETVQFILAGKDVEKRIEVSKLFDNDHLFAKKNVLYLDHPGDGEPRMSGKLVMDEEYVDLFTTGKISKPRLSSNFPAELITTELTWDDLVLGGRTLGEIKEIETWLKYNDTLLNHWQMKGKIKPGFRVLFHGPAGTGKTMTACLLGKFTGRDVYRIDLSTVVSKYIGETEKNLSKLFNKAANKDWILFFDEADSIFGKRTNVRDAHDKYANQEVSYLLQRIESHPGLVILASNMKGNIDSSFTRRFNLIVEFENPGSQEREKLWKNYLPPKAKFNEDFSIREVARNFELTGANIVNVVHYAGLQAMKNKSDEIRYEDVIKGIRKEYEKEGKMMRSF